MKQQRVYLSSQTIAMGIGVVVVVGIRYYGPIHVHATAYATATAYASLPFSHGHRSCISRIQLLSYSQKMLLRVGRNSEIYDQKMQLKTADTTPPPLRSHCLSIYLCLAISLNGMLMHNLAL
jgi:hypothetical protein